MSPPPPRAQYFFRKEARYLVRARALRFCDTVIKQMADEVKFLFMPLAAVSGNKREKRRRQRREVTIMRANSLDFFRLAFFTGVT